MIAAATVALSLAIPVTAWGDVLVFRATGIGTARVALALTRGDSESKAVRAAFYAVRVR